MILIDNTIVSDHLIEREFICNLSKCKGECCIAGESGAPLEKEETEILDAVYEKVKPYMEAEGIKAVEEFGKWMIDGDGDYVTPLINGDGQCAYVFSEDGISKCAFEKAHQQNEIDFQKPISCHLYPVRITKHKKYDAVNYEQWNICADACTLGKEKGVPVFQFVKTALIRKYGEDWFKQLEGASKFVGESSIKK